MMRLGLLALLLGVGLLPWASMAAAKANQCETCRNIATKFAEGMKKTEGKGFAGGNTAWEETRLGQYSTSETRLTEIHESLCRDKDYDCFTVLEAAEEHIETWWQKRAKPGVPEEPLFDYLCVKALKSCCPAGHYGKSCKICPGGVEYPCSGHGKCAGEGTRKGNGKCSCDEGYEGLTCTDCKSGYFLYQRSSEGSSDRPQCRQCHAACTTCVGPDMAHCKGCKEGYTFWDGCVDVDECTTDNPCVVGEYCVNKLGTHACNDCDRACARDAGCRGPGSGNCTACAPGFSMDANKTCIDINECDTHKCEVGRYCENTHGSFICQECDATCSAEGCTGPGGSACVSCKEGYSKDLVSSSCQDIDECLSSPCGEGFTCTNTRGAHTCACNAPNEVRDGKCVPPHTEL